MARKKWFFSISMFIRMLLFDFLSSFLAHSQYASKELKTGKTKHILWVFESQNWSKGSKNAQQHV